MNLPSNSVFLGSTSPYVKLITPSTTRSTSITVNSRNPVWNESLSLGFMNSASEITVEVWYAQPSFRFVDELIKRITIRVPFCHTLNATYETLPCEAGGNLVNCRATDSLWGMPRQQMCRETGTISLNTGEDNCAPETGDSCLTLSFAIVPYAAQTLQSEMSMSPLVTAAAVPVDLEPWTLALDHPYIDLASQILDLNIHDSAHISGALMLQLSSLERSVGLANSLRASVGVNYPSIVYICRSETDNAKGVPPWISATFNSQNISTTRLLIEGGIDYYGCYFAYSEGTSLNQWGELEKGAIPLRANTIAGHEAGSSDLFYYSSMYIVLLVPLLSSSASSLSSLAYTYPSFLQSYASYGVIWLWFVFMVSRYLAPIRFRVNRVVHYVRKAGFNPELNSIFTSLLFADSLKAPKMKSHLFYATGVIYFFLLTPFLLLIPWAIQCILTVSPTSLGVAILLICPAFLAAAFGLKLWQMNQWRLTSAVIYSFIAALILLLTFELCLLFTHPGANSPQEVDFTALSLIFCTFYALLRLHRWHDARQTLQGQNLSRTVSRLVRHPNESAGATNADDSLRSHLDHFTIDSSSSTFRYSHILTSDFESHSDWRALFPYSVLIPYLVLAGIFTESSLSLAFLHFVTLIFLDYIHRTLSHSTINCSSAMQIIVFILTRLLIMGAPTDSWLIFYSTVYFIYAMLLSLSILHALIPIYSSLDAVKELLLTKRGKSGSHLSLDRDLSRNPIAALVLLTLYLIYIVLAVDLGSTTQSLEAMYFRYSFVVLAITVPPICALIIASFRTMYLKSVHLLHRLLQQSFCWLPGWGVPLIFAMSAELMVLSTGIILYGFLNHSNAVLISAVFLPPIFTLFYYAFLSWTRNSFVMVKWPPDDSGFGREVTKRESHKIETNREKHNEDDDVVLLNETFNHAPEYAALKEIHLRAPLPEKSLDVEQIVESSGATMRRMPKLPLKNARVLNLLKDNETNLQAPSSVLDGEKEAGKLSAEAHDDEEEDDSGEEEYENVYGAQSSSEGYRQGLLPIKPNCYGEKIAEPSLERVGWSFLNTFPFRLRRYRIAEATTSPTEGPHMNMTFFTAFLKGYLTTAEYKSIGSLYLALALLLLYGELLSAMVSPSIIGHCVWVVSWCLVAVIYNLVGFLFTFEYDFSTVLTYKLTGALHLLFCLFLFLVELKSSVHSLQFFWLLDYFLMAPITAAFVTLFIILYDERCLFPEANTRISSRLTKFLRDFYFTSIFAALGFICLTIQVFFWVNAILAYFMGALLLLALFVCWLHRHWQSSHPTHFEKALIIVRRLWILLIVISFSIGLFSSTETNPLFPLSISIFLSMGFLFQKNYHKFSIVGLKSIYFAPTYFPMYSYDHQTSKLSDETALFLLILQECGFFMLWGCIVAIFMSSSSTGIIILSVSTLVFGGLIVIQTRGTGPQTLLLASHDFITLAAIESASSSSSQEFLCRSAVMLFDGNDSQNKAASALRRTNSVLSSVQSCSLLSDELEANLMMLSSLPCTDISPPNGDFTTRVDVETGGHPSSMSLAQKSLRHEHAPYSMLDAIAEIILTGGGPFGFLGIVGGWRVLLRLRCFEPSWLKIYDDKMNRRSATKLDEGLDQFTIANRILEAENLLEVRFREEYRLGVNFIISLTRAVISYQLKRKGFLERYLVHNCHHLRMEGIRPPRSIIESKGVLRTNLGLALAWTTGLPARKYNHLLRSYRSFQENEERKEVAVDVEDKLYFERLGKDILRRKDLESKYLKAMRELELKIFEQRLQLFNNRDADMGSDAKGRLDWVLDGKICIPEEDTDLFAAFSYAMALDIDPLLDLAKHELSQEANLHRNCRQDMLGRATQFFDPLFPPLTSPNREAISWKPSQRLCENARLFAEGTDPDDICPGSFQSGWILSALAMLAAGSGVGNNVVDEQVSQVFLIGTCSDEIGLYTLKLFLHQDWSLVILDDTFPLLPASEWTNKNRGTSSAHTQECSQLWVPLIEKAFAKVYGGYDELQGGFVQHALSVLTGIIWFSPNCNLSFYAGHCVNRL